MAKIRSGETYLGTYLCPNDYYSEREAISGQWIGKGAERLGLAGKITGDDQAFENLRCNRLPDGSGKLTARDGKDRISFYDFQCSSPKSVSIMGATMGDQRLVAAHDEAVGVAFRELERFAACQNNSRIDRMNRITGNVIAARFRHTTSRALDPQLHDHIVTANATWDESTNTWKALTEFEMLKAVRYAGKVFQNELAKRCLSLGYFIEETHDSQGEVTGFEIKGVPKELLERFSKRRFEIEKGIVAFQKEYGREPSVREIGVITRTTRAEKLTEITAQEVLTRQKDQLTAQEFAQLDSIKKGARNPILTLERRERECLRMAASHMYERRSVVLGHELLADALNRNLGGLDLERLSSSLGKSSLVALADEKNCPLLGSSYATLRGIRLEKWAVGFVNEGIGRYEPLVSNFRISEKLSKEQHDALAAVLGCRDQVASLRGAAGVGKTTVLKELDQALLQERKTCWYCAPTSSAAGTLRMEGIAKATTVSDLLLNIASRESLKNAVLIVDEAGLSSNKQGAELLRLAAKNQARVLFVGDSRQHTSVEAGDFLRVLEAHSRMFRAEITEIRRQSTRAYREAIQEMAVGSVREGLERLDALGWIKEANGSYLEAAAKDYLHYFGDGKRNDAVLGVAPTWDESHTLTAIIRRGLKERKFLGEEKKFTVYESLQWTAEQKRTGHYEPGYILTFNRGANGFSRGETAEVVSSEPGNLQIRSEKGIVRQCSASPECFDVSRKREIGIAAGDRLLIRANKRDMKLINGEVVTVAEMIGDRLKTVDERWIDTKLFRHFTHGYVLTSHKSQSKTADHVIVAASLLSEKSAYVGCSRGRFSCVVHSPDRTELLQRLPQGSRTAALDISKPAVSLPEKRVLSRTAAWTVKAPLHIIGAAKLLSLTPASLCVHGALTVGGWVYRWWRGQVDKAPLDRKHVHDHESSF